MSHPRFSIVALGSIATLATYALGCKCNSDAVPGGALASSSFAAGPDASPDSGAMIGAASSENSATAARAPDAGADFAGGECPDFEPERWKPWKGLPDESRCWFFSPASRDKMPAPLVWEPCPRPEDFGSGCRRIRLAPGTSLDIESSGDLRDVDAPAKGTLRIQLGLGCGRQRSRIHLVADVNGPILAALANDSEWSCRFTPALTDDGWGAEVQVHSPGDDTGFVESVFLAGSSRELEPRKVDKEPAPVRVGPANLSIYTKKGSVATVGPFMGRDGPSARDGLDAASDGVDLVWLLAVRIDRTVLTSDLTCVVATAPWTEQPERLEPRRVTTLKCVDFTRWTVGGGHAATTMRDGKAYLVRLRDGVTWKFPKLCGPLDTNTTCNDRPLAMTSKEMFLAVGGPSPNVYRLRYDALPAGTPPDEPPGPLPTPARPGDAGAP